MKEYLNVKLFSSPALRLSPAISAQFGSNRVYLKRLVLFENFNVSIVVLLL